MYEEIPSRLAICVTNCRSVYSGRDTATAPLPSTPQSVQGTLGIPSPRAGVLPHFPCRGIIIKPTACSAPPDLPLTPHYDRLFAFRSRGTPVAAYPQSSRQAQRPRCGPLPQPGDGAGGCLARSGGGRDPAQIGRAHV